MGTGGQCDIAVAGIGACFDHVHKQAQKLHGKVINDMVAHVFQNPGGCGLACTAHAADQYNMLAFLHMLFLSFA